MTENEILDVLHGVQHPELQSDIVSLGMVDGVRIDEEGIRITIVFARARDPFAQAIRKRSEEAVASRYPQYAGKISVFVKEAPPKKKNERQTGPAGRRRPHPPDRGRQFGQGRRRGKAPSRPIWPSPWPKRVTGRECSTPTFTALRSR